MGRRRRRDNPATSGRKAGRVSLTVTEADRAFLAELTELRRFSGEIASANASLSTKILEKKAEPDAKAKKFQQQT